MNTACSVCAGPSTKFCVCRRTITTLCDRCIGKHETQSPREMHDYNPSAYESVARQIGIDTFQARKVQIFTGTSLVQQMQESENRQYFEAIQRLEQVMKQYRDWLDYLHGCFLAQVQRFEAEKLVPLMNTNFNLSTFTYTVFSTNTSTFPPEAQIVETSALEQLVNNMNELHVRLYQACGVRKDFEEYFAGIVTEKAFESSAQNSLPVYSRTIRRPQPSLSAAAQPQQPQASYEGRLFVPFSRGKLLAKWMSDNGDLDRVVLSRPLDFTNVTVSVILPDGNMMCCGGREASEFRALTVNTTTGEVTMHPDMKAGRGNPGIVHVDGVVFVFGGFNSDGDELATGERFPMQQKSWTVLKNKMASSRFQFTPTAHLRTIYVAGGWHTTGVEAFDIATETFTTLPLILPKQFGTTVFVYNGELVIAQDHKLIRWKLNSRTGDFQASTVGPGMKDSNIGVQVRGTKAYFTHETKNKCDVQVVDLQTWDVSEVANLSAGGSGQQCPVS